MDWRDILVHMHLSLGACHWYLAVYDAPTRTVFGFAILNDDLAGAAWTSVEFEGLRNAKKMQGEEVVRDPFWEPTHAGEVESICEAYQRRRG